MKNDQVFIDDLIRQAQARFSKKIREIVDFETNDQDAEILLSDIDNFPHLFVLGCIADRQIRAGRAWLTPYIVGKECGGFDFRSFFKLTILDAEKIFEKHKLHRFNKRVSGDFVSAIGDIHAKYGGDASKIWQDKPPSARVVRRFLEFRGVGIKIATMAANILARHFKIEMSDYSSIDISPDVQVTKFFVHHKLLRENARREELIYLARELNPSYPGLLDFLAWKGGRALKRP